MGPLGRSITGFFGDAETPTRTNLRRWASSTRKEAFGVNIYEMAGHNLLFEFPNKHMAEQILQGDWVETKSKIQLNGGNCLLVVNYPTKNENNLD